MDVCLLGEDADDDVSARVQDLLVVGLHGHGRGKALAKRLRLCRAAGRDGELGVEIALFISDWLNWLTAR